MKSHKNRSTPAPRGVRQGNVKIATAIKHNATPSPKGIKAGNVTPAKNVFNRMSTPLIPGVRNGNVNPVPLSHFGKGKATNDRAK